MFLDFLSLFLTVPDFVFIPVPNCSLAVPGGGMEYGVIGTSDQSDTKDGLEELCPVCGDKEWLFYHAHPLFEETRLFLHTRYTAKIKRQGFSCTPVIRPTWRYKVFHAHPLYVLFEETKFFLHTRYTANMKRQGFSCTSVMLWRRCFFCTPIFGRFIGDKAFLAHPLYDIFFEDIFFSGAPGIRYIWDKICLAIWFFFFQISAVHSFNRPILSRERGKERGIFYCSVHTLVLSFHGRYQPLINSSLSSLFSDNKPEKGNWWLL